jgi:hypothetical protein
VKHPLVVTIAREKEHKHTIAKVSCLVEKMLKFGQEKGRVVVCVMNLLLLSVLQPKTLPLRSGCHVNIELKNGYT